jgi:hypothetical protein
MWKQTCERRRGQKLLRVGVFLAAVRARVFAGYPQQKSFAMRAYLGRGGQGHRCSILPTA